MANFIGTEANDVANAAIGELTGFTGGSVAELTDGVGDFFAGGGGEDFVFAANANDLIEGGEGHDVLNGGAGDDTIYGNTEPNPAGSLIGDEIVGNLGNDTLVGSNGNDVMEGAQDQDILRGGGGADTLRGGDGRDRLVFSTDDVSFGETIDGGNGIDAIAVSGTVTFINAASISSIEEVFLSGDATATFTANQVKTGLAANLHIVGDYKYGAGTFRIEMGSETLIDVPDFTFDDWNTNDRIEIVGDADDEVIFGTAQTDHLFGNGGDDTLAGGVGADQLFGGLGNDVYFVDPAGSEVFELAGAGNDSVVSFFSHTLAANVENLTLLGTGSINGTGNTLANTIVGNSGTNFLDGGAGADSLQGGLGNDTYLVNVTTDAVVEGANAGIDQVNSAATFTLGANVENLTLLGSAAISGTGNALVNNVTGNTSDNTLNGRAGADFLRGGLGNDIYVVDNVADKAIEAASAGTDRVDSVVTFTLGANVENLTLTGVAAISGAGNTLANIIIGNGANNALNGLAGADSMRGGLGNDSYIVDNVSDQVVESAGAGTDHVISSVSEVLALNVENLTLSGTAAISGTGNTLNNSITGNAANNILAGSSGNDSLNGGTGNDVLVGGVGKDAITGGAGADDFDFNVVADMGSAAATRDVITDFTVGDDIDLSTIDANGAAAGNTAFSFLAANGAAFTGVAGQLRWQNFSSHTLVEGDINGDRVSDFQIQLTGSKNLTAADFIL